VKSDVSLSYRLLRYANNVHFNRGQRMSSIGQALLVVGELEFRRLVTVLAMAGLAQDRPEALVTQALTRARFCELILRATGRAEIAEEGFLVGLFSLIDAMLGRPLAEILEQIPLADRVLEALVPGRGELNSVLRYAIACERGQWPEATALAANIGLDESAVPQVIADAHAFGRAVVEERREAA
jgi:EAL and modified HD-GYP domain-containing signal transduction protein